MSTAVVTPPAWLDRREYPFPSRAQPLRAGAMHYVDEGEGEPILFVHGTPTWSFDYRHLIRALSPRYRCIAPDLLGFGLSDRPDHFPYTPEAHAAALREFVEAIRLETFTLVVHDFGGPIALPLALDHPGRVRRLVLINTWMWSFDDDPAMLKKARLAGGAFGRWMYRHLNFSQRVLMPSAYGDRRALTPALHQQHLALFTDKDARVRVLHTLARALTTSGAFYAGLWRQAPRLRALPALIVWGLKDHAFPPSFLDRWIALLPEAEVVRFASAGHWPHEEEPDAVAAAITSWLATHEPAPADRSI